MTNRVNQQLKRNIRTTEKEYHKVIKFLDMRMIVISWFFVLVFFIGGCKGQDQQLNFFNNQLILLQKTKIYKDVKSQSFDTLNAWISKGITAPGIPSLRSDKWKFDNAIFFNNEKTKCYLLILDIDTSPNATMDYVDLMFGNYENHKWNFYFKSLTNFVFPREMLGKSTPLSFDELSYYSRLEIIKSYYKRGSYTINNDFFSKHNLEILKEKHREFLNEKDP